MSKRYQSSMNHVSLGDPTLLATLLVHVGRAARPGNGEADGLTAAQWAALRYFSLANTLSRTPSAFASFHATSRGTASQTIKALIARGLLARARSGDDRRSVRIDVTKAGMAALADDPMHRLREAIAALPAEICATLSVAMTTLVCAVDAARRESLFGVCPDCANCVRGPAEGAWCCRHSTALAPEDLSLLCADFAPRAGAAAP
jgi:DNA-binding MarR family transcriptional regulator